MGNVVISPPCFQPNSSNTTKSSSSSSQEVKLIFWEGTSRSINNKNNKKKQKLVVAGEIMFEFPDKVVCHADSFFIGHPIPILSFDDQLLPGQTYFVLPIDLFTSQTLSASTLASLNSSASSSPSSSSYPKNITRSPIKFGACSFQYLKGDNGRALIKVMPEFITSLIINNNNNNHQEKEDQEENNNNNNGSFLCSTPELQKHYEQLVRSKDQVWSPKLETISEYKIRFSPCRFIGLEWKEKEKHQQIFTR
ncbi:hypothetical protein PIB30_021030 [Stylosanthes scabra]|uniref:Uncharacterized protein n=1 Tax=Stylosanthes scabra TaxID=79078 RepID=A0ABU6V8W9_9FABA|nr:hypothetical protein [Stylosanthes scabra]